MSCFRKQLWNHKSKDHKDKEREPLPKRLETCLAQKSGPQTSAWQKLQDEEDIMSIPRLQEIDGSTNFRIDGPFVSKSGVLQRFQAPAESVFEDVKFNDKLMFWSDATSLIARIKSVSADSQYFLRRVAKRKHNGEIPIAGFQTLSCKSSETLYSRTAARFLYYIMKMTKAKPPVDISEVRLGDKMLTQSEFIIKLISSAIRQDESQTGWLAESYLHHVYTLKPYGAVSRDPDFLKHESVRLLYIFRGVFIIWHYDKKSLMLHADNDGKQFLSEQCPCAFESVQSFKRLAAMCVQQDPEDRICWQPNGEIAVNTSYGYIDVPKSSIQAFYQCLIDEITSIFTQMQIDPTWFDLTKIVDSNAAQQHGHGLLNLNDHILASMCDSTSLHFKAPCSRWFGSRSQPKTDEQKHAFLRLSSQLGMILQLCLHLSGGPGARMTEECAWLVSNSQATADRNIRFVRGAICVVNTYSKSTKQQSKAKDLVVTFADAQLSQLVVAYLVLVKRIEGSDVSVYLQSVPECISNSCLYFCIKNGRPLDGTKLGAFFRAKLTNFGLNIHVSDLRHILEGYARQIGCHLADSFENIPLLRTANHGHDISSQVYALSNHDLNGVGADVMCICAQYSETWNRELLKKESALMLVRPWDSKDVAQKTTFQYAGGAESVTKEVLSRRSMFLRNLNVVDFKTTMQKDAYIFFEERQHTPIDKCKHERIACLCKT
jgi:hypothetical protein